MFGKEIIITNNPKRQTDVQGIALSKVDTCI